MNKKLAFGCMRLPMKNSEVDKEEFIKMVDLFINRGFTYFDTAHGYISGKSEKAIKECLTSRYDHSQYTLTDKLTDEYFNTKEDIKPFFESQLKICGVEYFDYYLLHSINRHNYNKFIRCNAIEVCSELKKEGKIKCLGLSFHDKADFLDEILTKHPEIEIVQIQFNYYDYDSSSIESRKCYEVCRKHNKPILIMEPVKGGKLANLEPKAKKVFAELNNGTPASYAIRFAASFEGVVEVLSGMSNLEQMQDNLSYMENFVPLQDYEYDAIKKVLAILHGEDGIECTNCRYCVDGCPKKILIPDLFNVYNQKIKFNDWNSSMYYDITTNGSGKASDCIKCGKCEKTCPQHLTIRKYLEIISEKFEKR